MDQCAAKEYGDCTSWGHKEVDVLFLYRDKYGTHLPDETVKVCMCEAHRSVLEKYQEGRPLEMRGEEVDRALHDDLFTPFSSKNNTYTYVKIHMKRQADSDNPEYKFCLINGRDIEKFRELMSASDPEIVYISEEAIFLTHFNVGNCLDRQKDEEEVIEMKPVTGEYEIDVLKNLTTYYKPVSEKITTTGPGWLRIESRIEENPTLETEYTIESALPCVQGHFAQKWEDQFRANFKECLEFMDNIEHTLVDIKKLRETSQQSEEELLALVRRLTDALCVNDRECIAEMKEAGEITEEVLWVTYVLANHELYWSHIPGRNLRKNIPLIKLFINAGIHDRLLLLAVSGERERCLDIHHRTHHDILHENEYVVRYLVPTYFQPRTLILLREGPCVTYISAYTYYTDFCNAMYNCNPFCDKEEPFDKNENILLHLLTCVVEENNALEEKYGHQESLSHKEFRAEYKVLLEKMKEKNERWGSDKYREKEELEWKKALEKEVGNVVVLYKK